MIRTKRVNIGLYRGYIGTRVIGLLRFLFRVQGNRVSG